MAYPYEIDHRGGIVTVRYEAPITFERWRQTMDRILADPEYLPGYCFLGDRRGVADVPDTNYAKSVVEYFTIHRKQLSGAAWAHVVDPGRDAVYGMARMVEILANMRKAIEVRVFDDEQEARAWLATKRQA